MKHLSFDSRYLATGTTALPSKCLTNGGNGRREIEAVSLVFPSVSFSLEDNARDKRDSLAQNRVLNIPKAGFVL